MALIRRYGPVQGAGTTITEKLAEATIVQSPLGVVAWAGIVEKGDPAELLECVSKSDFYRKCGYRIPDSYLPDCAEDFWDAGRGKGRMFVSRVTDGTERKATLTLKTREHSTTSPGPGRWRDVMQVDAKSGGRWAGAYNRKIGEISGSGDLSETTIDTGLTLLLDEFAGGTLQMAEIAGETFNIIGNTVLGVVTVAADSLLATKFASGTNNEFVLFKNDLDVLGNDRALDVLVKDGARAPDTEFGAEIFLNKTKVLEWPDLSMDPDSDKYFVTVINDDTGNEEIRVTDLFNGTLFDMARPANQAGQIPTAGLAETVLTLEWYQAYNDSTNTGDGTVGSIAVKASTQPDFITLTCNSVTTPGSEDWTVESTTQDRTFDDAVTAVAYVGPNNYFLDFTVSVGATPWAVSDKIYIMVNTVIPEEVVGGRLFYDIDASPLDSLTITAATVATVSVSPGNDLTTLSAVGQTYRLQYGQGLHAGYDGHSGVVDNDHVAVWDLDNSLFKQMMNKQLGLIKYAVPGVASTTVQKAARTFAEANNGPFRMEIPVGTTTETSAIDWVENTMGRNDFNQVIFPSWSSKKDPDRSGLKQVPLTGAVQGVEALYAYNWQGYHKAAAGVAAILEKTVKIPTGDRIIDDELTNPKGLQVVLKKEGNWVIWGDRVPATSTGLFFKHKREQLSHYERVLFENFDWIIFAINDPDTEDLARAALTAYFLPEWKPKRALRGNTFAEAASIKLDAENNTNATRATGDMNAEITLRLADTVERFNIIISPAGVFEELVG